MNLFPLICTRANSSWNVILSCTGLSSWNGLTSWNLPLINFNALESFDYPEFDEGYVPFCLSQSISETQFDRFQRVFFHITIFSNLTKIGPNPPPPLPPIGMARNGIPVAILVVTGLFYDDEAHSLVAEAFYCATPHEFKGE